MAKENKHVKTLVAALDKLVEERRELAADLLKPYKRGDEKIRERFTDLQETIAAVEEAISHEWRLASPEQPSSFAPPIVESKPRDFP